MPDQLSSRHLRKRLLQLGIVLLAVGLVVWLTPGLGPLRQRLDRASAPWLIAAALFEVLSSLSYVVVFRAAFCARMPWRTSYQIGMAEQAANSLLPAGGAGGLALGAWALSRGGMSGEHIARRTVAFFFLTSLANFVTLIVFAVGFAVGAFTHDGAQWVTYAFGIAALIGIAFAVTLPAIHARWTARREPLRPDAGRLRHWLRGAVDALGNGAADSISLLRQRPLGVLVGSFGYMTFDIASLAAAFAAFGHPPAFGVVVVAYLIGQLGGLLPLPGGIGGTEGGLIGTYALYHVPLATSGAAVLAYRVVQVWIPGLLGSVAFVRLRSTLSREAQPAAVCEPLAEPIEVSRLQRSAR
jgi:uncharacterized protein (TIRG00374 family)